MPNLISDCEPVEAARNRRKRGWLWAMFRQRCPQCRIGKMFRGRLAMNDPCPHCGLIFQREEGYFLGAMYVSTILSIALTLPIYLIALLLIPGHDVLVATAATLLLYIPLIPAVFRYSRVLWIYADRAACPTNFSAGEFEKLRESERDGESHFSERT